LIRERGLRTKLFLYFTEGDKKCLTNYVKD